MREKEIN